MNSIENHLQELKNLIQNGMQKSQKKKHHKRRIVNANFLAQVHSKLKPGGFIHIATDWVPYAEWIEEVFAASTLFIGRRRSI